MKFRESFIGSYWKITHPYFDDIIKVTGRVKKKGDSEGGWRYISSANLKNHTEISTCYDGWLGDSAFRMYGKRLKSINKI